MDVAALGARKTRIGIASHGGHRGHRGGWGRGGALFGGRGGFRGGKTRIGIDGGRGGALFGGRGGFRGEKEGHRGWHRTESRRGMRLGRRL